MRGPRKVTLIVTLMEPLRVITNPSSPRSRLTAVAEEKWPVLKRQVFAHPMLVERFDLRRLTLGQVRRKAVRHHGTVTAANNLEITTISKKVAEGERTAHTRGSKSLHEFRCMVPWRAHCREFLTRNYAAHVQLSRVDEEIPLGHRILLGFLLPSSGGRA